VRDEDQQALLWLAGLWLLSKYTFEIAPAMQRGGASLYDWIHDDAGHKQHLPGRQLTRAAVLQLATQAGFPDPKLASAIAFAESGGVPGAITSSSRELSIGLWQINTRAHPQYPVEWLKDPLNNARAAYAISRGGSNWKPWSAFTSGAYHKFQTGTFA
jgi:hypothetical protein